ncbi:MAG: hypothetical protein K2X06_16235 [Burkholderiales bacterium]|nr:hypothetical protein [Burkholderiales bacterium]
MKKILMASLLAITLAGCAGYVPGQQSYWDAQVREMCEKDGGVTVYEQVKLTQSEYRRLGGTKGIVPVPSRNSADPNALYVADRKITKIREWSPQVFRLESVIVRVADGKVLSRQIEYGRIGGDFPSPSHSSSYGCSDLGLRLDAERQTFEIVEDSQ